jgi:hypothetical protein
MCCYKEELLGGVFKYIHKEFDFSTFQITMKHYRLALDYSSYLDLLAHETISLRSREYFPYQCMAQARIMAGSLFFRVQQVVMIPFDRNPRLLASCHITICPHVGNVSRDYKAPENAKCTTGHQHNTRSCIRSSGLKQCEHCPTEYQIDLQECGQLGVAAVITKWLDLGEGFTLLDPKWWSHLSSTYTNHPVFTQADQIHKERLQDRLPVHFKPGSIHASFEGSSPLAFNPLLTSERIDELSKLLSSWDNHLHYNGCLVRSVWKKDRMIQDQP